MSFSATSRYYSLATAQYTGPDGRTYTYVTRRIVPAPEKFSTLQTYTVVQGDRLDNVTARFLNDPTQFWRLCDSNRALLPEELMEPIGRKLRITLPEGVPGNPTNA